LTRAATPSSGAWSAGTVSAPKKDLVRAYRSGLLSTITRKSPWFRPTLYELSVVGILWRAFRLKPDQITFCPLCLHGF
jgi:hypothetical protein